MDRPDKPDHSPDAEIYKLFVSSSSPESNDNLLVELLAYSLYRREYRRWVDKIKQDEKCDEWEITNTQFKAFYTTYLNYENKNTLVVEFKKFALRLLEETVAGYVAEEKSKGGLSSGIKRYFDIGMVASVKKFAPYIVGTVIVFVAYKSGLIAYMRTLL